MLQRESVASIEWVGGIDGHLRLIDQTRLPQRLEFLECRTREAVWDAIKLLRVRGAPAIGVAAAYGLCVACGSLDLVDPERRLDNVQSALSHLATSRPTAVNLFWALDRMRRRAHAVPATATVDDFRGQLLDEARQIHTEDREVCHAIGRNGAELIRDGDSLLTHCNTGGLATSDYGTALSILFTAFDQGKKLHVYVDETRPLLQGSRLTAWELLQHGVPATLICDSVAAQVMKEGRVCAVIVGADRIAANGDTANKIGTYGLARLAKAHQIPFYVAAPLSTFDLTLGSGDNIPIEQRAAEEVTRGFGCATAPNGIDVYNPAFDVTPAEFIDAIITESGIIQPVTESGIRQVASSTGASKSSVIIPNIEDR